MHIFMPVVQHNDYMINMIKLINDYVYRYDLSDEHLEDFRNVSNLYVKQFGRYLKEPVEYELKSDLLDTSVVRASDRYNHFPETQKDHIDYMFFARRRNWYLNVLDLNQQ
jgi:hypothetical protein